MCLDLLRAPLFPRAYSHIENETIEMRHKYWFERTSNAISRLSCITPGISRYTFSAATLVYRYASHLWSLHFSPSFSLSVFHNASPSRSMAFKRFTWLHLINHWYFDCKIKQFCLYADERNGYIFIEYIISIRYLYRFITYAFQSKEQNVEW